jgi:hypothetical protein
VVDIKWFVFGGSPCKYEPLFCFNFWLKSGISGHWKILGIITEIPEEPEEWLIRNFCDKSQIWGCEPLAV